MSFVVMGETTREDVQQRFKEYEIETKLTRFDDDSVWVFSANRDTWSWLVCAGGGGYADCGTGAFTRHHFLKFEFDNVGAVKGWEAGSTLGECSAIGVCSDGNAITVLAAEERDAEAKAYESSTTCAVYIYATLRSDDTAYVFIDDTFAGWLMNSGAYIFDTLQPGPHHIVAMDVPYRSQMVGRAIQVGCTASQHFYFHYDGRTQKIEQHVYESDTGIAADARLDSRKLLLRPLKYPKLGDDGRSSRSLTVGQVQRRLAELGYFDGSIDGLLTDETNKAIRAFKVSQGLSDDDILDDETWNRLRLHRD